MVYDCPPDTMMQVITYATESVMCRGAEGTSPFLSGKSSRVDGNSAKQTTDKLPGVISEGFEADAKIGTETRNAAGDKRPVEAAIADAAQLTSIDYNYLLAQAEVESAMDPDARARTSSATGLYQFIEATWIDTVKKHGKRFGLGALANEITLTASGNAYIVDPARREMILALRHNPQVASLMAAALAEDNLSYLAPILGRAPSHAELYLAHFLGAGGAGRFLIELQTDPSQSAAALFPRPAEANRAIFFRADGLPRSLAQVMDVIGGKLDRALVRATGGNAVRFARAVYNANESARVPYLVADEDVFGPGQSPDLTVSLMDAPPRGSTSM